MTSKSVRSICVYCGSRHGVDPKHTEAANALGEMIAEAGLKLIFGGGEQGLMREVAASARDAGAPVLGIIPTFLQAQEGLLDGIESREVETMHERKILMFEESDAFCILPGGIGTLEEMVEVLSWASLAIHKKPIILCNIGGYWDPFVELIDHICDGGFAYPGMRKALIEVKRVEDVIPAAMRGSEVHLEEV